MTETQLLRVDDVVRATQLSERHIRGLIAAGELPVVRSGRAVRIPRAWLEQWIKDRTTGVPMTSAVQEEPSAASSTRSATG